MSRIIYIPNRVIDANGISDGASVYVYQSGTSTPVSLFSDAGFTTPVSNPYVVSTGAPVPALYHNYAGNVRVRVVSTDGNVDDTDPYIIFMAESSLSATTGATLVGTSTAETVQVVLDRVDRPITASSGPSRVIMVNDINDMAPGLSAAVISGGGSTDNENYVGYHKNWAEFTATGTAHTWPHLPTDNDLTNLNLFKSTVNNVRSTLTTPADYTAVINGSGVDITLTTGLVSGEKLVVEDKAAKVLYDGTKPDYGGISYGYDNTIKNGVMHHIGGAHHRIIGGDHNTLFGGSYGIIRAGSYGLVLAGTSNEIGSGGGVGSVVCGGYRNRANGATSTVVGGQENLASGAQTFIGGGYRNTASATAAAAVGRNNTISGSDSFAAGDGNTISGSYSMAVGKSNTVSHNYSYTKGLNGTTSKRGQDTRFAYRDGDALWPQRQHFFLDLAQYTTTTSSALAQFLDGTTSITPPNSTAWHCRLTVTARGSNLKAATFVLNFAVQRDGSTTSLVGTTTKSTWIDPGMGTGGNVADVTVAIVSNALEITLQPRIDATVTTKWNGVLEILEVN